MKKLLLLTCLGLFLTASTASAQKAASTTTTTTMTTAASWTNSTSGFWLGQNNMSYKYNKTTNKVQISPNGGTTWGDAPTNSWMDTANKMYKVEGGKLKRSNDSGVTWVDASPASWKAFDGKIYKFDASWNLMVQN